MCSAPLIDEQLPGYDVGAGPRMAFAVTLATGSRLSATPIGPGRGSLRSAPTGMPIEKIWRAS